MLLFPDSATGILKMDGDNRKIIVQVDNCCKSFNGVPVFKEITFDLLEGEIHCICGENGAGKSTFVKIVSGAYFPDSGSIYIAGEKVRYFEPDIAHKMGVETIYQNQFLMPSLSVAENIFMGDYVTRGGFIDYKGLQKKAKTLLAELETAIDVTAIVEELEIGDRQTVQIARALAKDAKVLILDEPTASFGIKETKNLMKIIRKIAARGIGVIYISHHLDEIFELADRVTVIRDGQKISCYAKDEISAEKIIRDMVGRDTDLFYRRGTITTGLTGTLEVRNLYKENYVSKSSFIMKRGEILGFGGMAGSGRTELASLIFGAVRADGGEVLLDGKNILPKDPCEAIQRGICLITEDRQKTGLFLGHSTGWNFVSAFINKSRDLLVQQKKGDSLFSEYVKKIEIKTEGADQDVRFLSGGNQQKVVLAKWIYTKGEVVIFDEPTKGIDIGAKEDVYKMIVELANEGKFIIIISSEMPELIAMSDRVFIMKKRKIVAELIGDTITEENILSYSIGGVS